jgi:hypothetical protein
MAAAQRLQEVTSLLALGFLRWWATRAPDGGDRGLDVLRTSSDECPKLESEGESE